jgi:DedD protein
VGNNWIFQMNKNISEEELLLRKRARRRLVGAIVLVVAAVIILPMIFDEPKPESGQQEIAIHLPSDNVVRETPSLILPSEELPNQDGYEDIDLAELMPTESAGASLDNQMLSDDVMKHIHVPIPGIKPQFETFETAIENTPAVATKGFVVQLGAFSDLSKAEQQQRNLMSNGIKAYTETIRVDNNQVTRVRIGPYSTRNTAEDELAKLKKLGLDGVVTSP